MMVMNQQPALASLQSILAGLGLSVDSRWASILVSGLCMDSRKVKDGDVFIACQGAVVNGLDFIPQAIKRGAVAILVEKTEMEILAQVPVIAIANLSDHISAIAGEFYHHPSRSLRLIGVTGTNGKTSCTQFVLQLLNLLGRSCGVIGTLGAGVDGELQAGINTTPDAISIQKTLAQWQPATDVVAMEVSSHGLEQSRVAGLVFDVAVFTNLTRDHLDYHGDMESYGAAKAKLFKQAGLKAAVINVDDDFGRDLIQQLPASLRAITYSLGNGQSDVYASNIKYLVDGISAQIYSPWGEATLNCSLFGHFNLSNVLAAISCLAAQGIDFYQLVTAAKQLKPVAGRMDLLLGDTGSPSVVIDYAHTPDALEQALKALRLHVDKKLYCVFGCGGDRDQGKRPLMGEVAARLADKVWVTSDNPRTENAQAIIEQINQGISANGDLVVKEVDRAKAIEQAILAASADDLVLIAGKGHEDYQQVGSQRLPFDDAKQARLALAKRASL